MVEPSRTAAEKHSGDAEELHSPAKRQAPPARADGIKLVSYSSEAHNAMRLAYYGAPTNARDGSTDPERAFNQHIDALQQRYGNGLVPRQADSIIALKMAQSGWQPEEVAAALRSCRTNTDLPAQQVPAYAERVTAQAFGRAAKEAATERHPSIELER